MSIQVKLLLDLVQQVSTFSGSQKVVENELDHVKKDFERFSTATAKDMKALADRVEKLEKKRKLTTREIVMIVVALITTIGSVAIAIIQVYKPFL